MTRRKQYLRAVETERRYTANLAEINWRLRDESDPDEVARLLKIHERIWVRLLDAAADARSLCPEELTCGARGAW